MESLNTLEVTVMAWMFFVCFSLTTIYSNGERINKFKKKGTNNQPKRPSPLWGVPIPHTAVGLRGASNAYE